MKLKVKGIYYNLVESPGNTEECLGCILYDLNKTCIHKIVGFEAAVEFGCSIVDIKTGTSVNYILKKIPLKKLFKKL